MKYKQMKDVEGRIRLTLICFNAHTLIKTCIYNKYYNLLPLVVFYKMVVLNKG